MAIQRRTEVVTETDTTNTNTKVARNGDARAYSAIDQLVYLIFGIIEALLLIRFIFRLTGANPAAGIVSFIYSVTNVLMAPFRFIFPTASLEGSVFEWSVLVAMVFYALLAWIIMKLIRITYTADSAN